MWCEVGRSCLQRTPTILTVSKFLFFCSGFSTFLTSFKRSQHTFLSSHLPPETESQVPTKTVRYRNYRDCRTGRKEPTDQLCHPTVRSTLRSPYYRCHGRPGLVGTDLSVRYESFTLPELSSSTNRPVYLPPTLQGLPPQDPNLSLLWGERVYNPRPQNTTPLSPVPRSFLVGTSIKNLVPYMRWDLQTFSLYVEFALSYTPLPNRGRSRTQTYTEGYTVPSRTFV